MKLCMLIAIIAVNLAGHVHSLGNEFYEWKAKRINLLAMAS